MMVERIKRMFLLNFPDFPELGQLGGSRPASEGVVLDLVVVVLKKVVQLQHQFLVLNYI